MSQTHPLVHLLPTNIMQPAVQIANALHDILHLILVLRLDLARLANGNIQRHPDSALGTGQPAASRGVRVGRETDAVLAGVRSGESKAAGVVLALGDDAVVVVEGLLDANEHLQVLIDRVGVAVGIEDCGFKFACFTRGND